MSTSNTELPYGEQCLRNLESIVAIDSQSDAKSPTIPSTAGQRDLALFLQKFFNKLGFTSEFDSSANLLVRLPGGSGKKLVLMAHVDTSEGTQALPKLERLKNWDGSRIPFPENSRLQVSTERYPDLKMFLNQEIVFGTGKAAFGLDDKLGLAQLMTLAEIVSDEKLSLPQDTYLAFRPDEEIGRMEAVVGLAKTVAEKKISFGYTIDGYLPFEINTENFNASAGQVVLQGKPLSSASLPLNSRFFRISMIGVKSHGATAKSEGYLNSLTLLANWQERFAKAIFPIEITSHEGAETDADAIFAVGEPAALETLKDLVAEHGWRGATVSVTPLTTPPNLGNDSAYQALSLVSDFISSAKEHPVLSEHSDDREGYSNPYFAKTEGSQTKVNFRLRDFDPAALKRREADVRYGALMANGSCEIASQYIDMGPVLAKFPELVTKATDALKAFNKTALVRPIRGGTGVDPFLEYNIPIANLGTGYWGLESEKEFTTVEMMDAHVGWLREIVTG